MAEVSTDHSEDWQGLGVSILHRLVMDNLLDLGGFIRLLPCQFRDQLAGCVFAYFPVHVIPCCHGVIVHEQRVLRYPTDGLGRGMGHWWDTEAGKTGVIGNI